MLCLYPLKQCMHYFVMTNKWIKKITTNGFRYVFSIITIMYKLKEQQLFIIMSCGMLENLKILIFKI